MDMGAHSMDMQHGDMDIVAQLLTLVQHGTWIYSILWICSIEIGMQYGHGHAARTWICDIKMDMWH
jgi:hypothetical protein